MYLLIQISFDESPDTFFAFDRFKINHFTLSFHRKTGIDFCNRKTVAFCQFPPQGTFTGEYLDFNMVAINSAQLSDISCINIMQMDTAAAFAQFSVGWRKLLGCR